MAIGDYSPFLKELGKNVECFPHIFTSFKMDIHGRFCKYKTAGPKMTNKDKYRAFCQKEASIPIFSQDWWLDAVCGEDNWDVSLVEKGGEIVATLPYYLKIKYGFKLIMMPKLTQTLGPWLKYQKDLKYSARLAFDKEVFSALIAQLPKYDAFSQNFAYSISNWLPFYWKGFQQTTKYTYVLEDISDIEKVCQGFTHAKMKNIRKAQNIVKVQYDLSAEQFYANHKMTLAKQNDEISYSFELFNSIYKAAYSRQAAKTIYATDTDGNIHSAFFVVWDSCSAYYLISTIDPSFRDSGSSSLLMREIIQYLSDKVKVFNFEGSMMENVENSFRQFGPVQKPYCCITKANSKLIKLSQFIHEIAA